MTKKTKFKTIKKGFLMKAKSQMCKSIKIMISQEKERF